MKNGGQSCYNTNAIRDNLSYLRDKKNRHTMSGIRGGIIGKAKKKMFYIFDEQFNLIDEVEGRDALAEKIGQNIKMVTYYINKERPTPDGKYISTSPFLIMF